MFCVWDQGLFTLTKRHVGGSAEICLAFRTTRSYEPSIWGCSLIFFPTDFCHVACVFAGDRQRRGEITLQGGGSSSIPPPSSSQDFRQYANTPTFCQAAGPGLRPPGWPSGVQFALTSTAPATPTTSYPQPHTNTHTRPFSILQPRKNHFGPKSVSQMRRGFLSLLLKSFFEIFSSDLIFP